MKIVMEIGKFETGTYEAKDKGGAKTGAVEPWLRLMGREVPERGSPEPAAGWVRTISYKTVAAALLEKLSDYEGEKIAAQRLIIELDGEWTERVQKSEGGKDRLVKSFIVNQFAFREGPSVELGRLRRDANTVMGEASTAYGAGDVKSAYLALEAFVAGVALRVAPGLNPEVPHPVSGALGPEERAQQAFSKQDARDLPRREEAKPVAEVPAATEAVEKVDVPEMTTHQAEVPEVVESPAPSQDAAVVEPETVDEAVSQEVDAASADADLPQEVAPEAPVEVAAEEAQPDPAPAPAPVGLTPPRRPLMMRRPPPPPVGGMKMG